MILTLACYYECHIQSTHINYDEVISGHSHRLYIAADTANAMETASSVKGSHMHCEPIVHNCVA